MEDVNPNFETLYNKFIYFLSTSSVWRKFLIRQIEIRLQDKNQKDQKPR